MVTGVVGDGWVSRSNHERFRRLVDRWLEGLNSASETTISTSICNGSLYPCTINVPEKSWPDGLALAYQNHRLSQSRQKVIITARLGSAYLDLAWPGSQPEARLGTALI